MRGNERVSGEFVPDLCADAMDLVRGATGTRGNGRYPVGGVAKRSLDVSLALIFGLLLLPLIILIALVVYFSNPGPIVYRHKRIGFGGKEFACLKFRTMVTDGERILREHLQQSSEARKEWDKTRKLTNDPRVTRLGAILRKSSLDELPQLLNVLRGDMSIVGPRPIVRDELEIYGASSSYYLKARPGLTGAWQISGRSDTTYAERIALDTHYVSQWSFITDFAIVVRTVPAVILAKGSR